jgi:putative transcriptional regulator
MAQAWCKRIPLILAALLLPAALLHAATTDATGPSGSSLAGQLLVASPQIAGPPFYHTVILMVSHDSTGALGIVINQPLEERSLASVLEGVGIKESGVKGSILIFAGGPVEPQAGFVIHSSEYHGDKTLDIDGHVAMTSSPQILRDMGHNKGPKKCLLAFGYAGWGPGQLEAEIARHDWFTEPEDPKLVFDDDRGGLWDEAMARRTRDL